MKEEDRKVGDAPIVPCKGFMEIGIVFFVIWIEIKETRVGRQ